MADEVHYCTRGDTKVVLHRQEQSLPLQRPKTRCTSTAWALTALAGFQSTARGASAWGQSAHQSLLRQLWR